jgi:hypothetical protein
MFIGGIILNLTLDKKWTVQAGSGHLPGCAICPQQALEIANEEIIIVSTVMEETNCY